MSTDSDEIIMLGANFGGNVGDLFILDAVVSFLLKETTANLQIYPFSSRNDKVVALPEVAKYRRRVFLNKPAFGFRQVVFDAIRHKPWLENLVIPSYFSALSKPLRPRVDDYSFTTADRVVVFGQELSVPYSLLDIHGYLRAMNAVEKSLIYGPISINPRKKYASFLRKRFSEVSRFFVRDPLTAEQLKGIGVENFDLIPDAAFLAALDGAPYNRANISDHGTIGLCLHSRWGYLERMEQFVSDIRRIAQTLDRKLIIFVTNIREDGPLVSKLTRQIQYLDNVDLVVPRTAAELRALLKGLDVVISDRLHGMLIGVIMGAAVLPLATRNKVRGYCRYMGLDIYLSGDERYGELESKLRDVLSSKLEVQSMLKDFTVRAAQEVADRYRRFL